jgi:hypothetical protein
MADSTPYNHSRIKNGPDLPDMYMARVCVARAHAPPATSKLPLIPRQLWCPADGCDKAKVVMLGSNSLEGIL